MYLILASLLDVVDRLEWIRGRMNDLLMYPKYMIFKGIDTIIDEKRICLGLKWNVYAPPFYPETFSQITNILNKEPSEHNCIEELNNDQSINVGKLPEINIPEAKEEWNTIKKNKKVLDYNIVKTTIIRNTNVVNTYGALKDLEEDGLSKVYGDVDVEIANTKYDQQKVSSDYNVESMLREMIEKVIEEYTIKEKNKVITDNIDDDTSTIVVNNTSKV